MNGSHMEVALEGKVFAGKELESGSAFVRSCGAHVRDARARAALSKFMSVRNVIKRKKKQLDQMRNVRPRVSAGPA